MLNKLVGIELPARRIELAGRSAIGSGKQVQEGLIAETQVIHLVCNARDLMPGQGAVDRFVDGEID